jgi:sigma-E factor negative regulatory protein RseC
MGRFADTPPSQDLCTAGKVVSVSEGRAVVAAVSSSCDGCGQAGSCNLLWQSDAPIEVETINVLGARAGDRVVVGYSSRAQVRTACILYLVPSISTVVGAAAGHEWLAGRLGIDPTLGGLMGAIVFLFLGLLPATFVSRRQDSLPHIVEIIREESRGDP